MSFGGGGVSQRLYSPCSSEDSLVEGTAQHNPKLDFSCVVPRCSFETGCVRELEEDDERA